MSVGDLQLPPGFRFHPTDEELVTNYLCRKCAAKHVAAPIIAEIDLYRYDPWQLPEMALYGHKEWYFFSPRDRKYPNGSRPNRAAGSGYWKATGADKPIGVPKPLGIKKALVFYAGKAPKGEKTNWIMHEYRLADVDRSARGNFTTLRLDEWVLCRIYKKKGGPPDKHTGTTPLLASMQMRIMRPPPPLQPLEYRYFENNDSTPRVHTDSSCSDHVAAASSCEREVQSESEATATWKGAEWDRKNEFSIDNVVRPSSSSSTTTSFPTNTETMSQQLLRDPALNDVFMYLQSPY